MGLPVFSPSALGLTGIAQILGPTGGFLMAYPFVAFLAGYIFERGAKSFLRAAIAGLLAEILLFAGGLTWLYVFTHSLAKAAYLGLYWFVAAEVIKVMFAAAIATRWQRGAQALETSCGKAPLPPCQQARRDVRVGVSQEFINDRSI